MANDIVVTTNRSANDILAEAVFQIYTQTGVRVQHAEFTWMETSVNGVTNRMLANVSVTSLGGPL